MAPSSTDPDAGRPRTSGASVAIFWDHERFEPPIAGDHQGAQERDHVSDQAEPAKGGGLAGVDRSQSEQQGAHPEQGEAVGQCAPAPSPRLDPAAIRGPGA
jgi:hypothetical protein